MRQSTNLIKVSEMSFAEWLKIMQGIVWIELDSNCLGTGTILEDLYECYKDDMNFAWWLERTKHIVYLVNQNGENINLDKNTYDWFYDEWCIYKLRERWFSNKGGF